VPVEVEATTLDEAIEAAAVGVDWILLDNMTPAEVAAVVERLRPRAAGAGGVADAGGTAATASRPRPSIEASGRITLDNARAYAETGVDAISVGAITHSAPAMDFSLLFESITGLA
jgi:nicotinate-nucleotide pyrophosphorylase (carboxylating)